jgi:glycine oxidase
MQYEEWAACIQDESGIDPEFERCGELQLAFSKSEWGILLSEERVAGERLAGGDPATHVAHKPDEVQQIEPAVTTDILGALDSRSTAQVRNPRVLQALKLACTNAGVDLREDVAVRDWLVECDRILGVLTGDEKIQAGQTILCAGAWSSTIGDRLQELMPVHPVLGQIILLKAEQRPFQRILSYGKQYLVPRRDGYILLGATEEPEAGFKKHNTPQVSVRSLSER